MPVSIAGIGESDNAAVKHPTVSALFAAWCNQVRTIAEKSPKPVRYIDLTAGCGVQSNGRPTFIANVRQIAGEHDLDIAMLACEERHDNATQLRSLDAIEIVLECRWQEALEAIRTFGRHSFCFIYHDPNACCKEHPDIIKLADVLPRADLCLHFDANQIKRIRRAGYPVTTIDELVNIRHGCVIREPFGVGSQWTVMYLSNCPMKDYSKYGFYRLGDSETGESILRRMQYTHEERKHLSLKGQGVLFDI